MLIAERYEELQLQGRLWTPAVWRGSLRLSCWHDFSNRAGSLTVATGVDLSKDLSGNGRNLSQAAGASQPAYSVTGWTGGRFPAIVPNGSQAMEVSPTLTYNGTNGLSFACIAYNSGSASPRVLFSNYAGSGAPMLRFENETLFLVRNFIVGILQSAAGTCPTGVRIVGCDAQTNAAVLWTDGGVIASSGAADPGFTIPINVILQDNGTSFFSGGPVGEMIWGLQRWTVSERALVDGYLHWRWNRTSKLVASHQFKNRPPLIGD